MRKQYGVYRYKNLRLRRRLFALGLASALGIGSFVLAKNCHDKEPLSYKEVDIPIEYTYEDNNYQMDTLNGIDDISIVPSMEVESEEIIEEEEVEEVPTYVESYVEPVVQDTFNRGDSVIATTTVNMRINSSKNSFKVGELPVNSVVDRIISINGWDLIRYNGKLAFVSSDYTNECTDYNNEYYRMEEYSDIVRTTTRLYFRQGPSKTEKDMCLLDENEELVVLGKATMYNDPSDIWYLVRARGELGFVKASYTKSLKSIIANLDPSIENIEIKKVGYLKEDTAIRNNPNGDVLYYGDKYQMVQVLQENGNYYLVNMDGKVGYISKNVVKNLSGTFVIVDISDQRVYMYCNTDVAFAGKCTTGKSSSPTELGYFSPYGKASYHNFGPDHNNVEARILWMPFNGGQGLHDAPWEDNSKFGDYNYAMRNGSAGCVRLPDEVASFLYDNINLNTNILVKK